MHGSVKKIIILSICTAFLGAGHTHTGSTQTADKDNVNPANAYTTNGYDPSLAANSQTVQTGNLQLRPFNPETDIDLEGNSTVFLDQHLCSLTYLGKELILRQCGGCVAQDKLCTQIDPDAKTFANANPRSNNPECCPSGQCCYADDSFGELAFCDYPPGPNAKHVIRQTLETAYTKNHPLELEVAIGTGEDDNSVLPSGELDKPVMYNDVVRKIGSVTKFRPMDAPEFYVFVPNRNVKFTFDGNPNIQKAGPIQTHLKFLKPPLGDAQNIKGGPLQQSSKHIEADFWINACVGKASPDYNCSPEQGKNFCCSNQCCQKKLGKDNKIYFDCKNKTKAEGDVFGCCIPENKNCSNDSQCCDQGYVCKDNEDGIQICQPPWKRICAPQNQECSHDGDCCGNLACQSGTCCPPRGSSCSADSDCCNGLNCTDGKCCDEKGSCETCALNKQSCQSNNDCCPPRRCDSENNNVCVDCKPQYTDCYDNSECCSPLVCNQRIRMCLPCMKDQGACKRDSDCCSGFTCGHDNKCQKAEG